MENLRQVLYNFHRNQVGGAQQQHCVSTTSSVFTSGSKTAITTQQAYTTSNHQTSIAEISSQQNSAQMPLLGSTASNSSSLAGVVVNNSGILPLSTESSPSSLILNQPQHVVFMTNNTLDGSNNSEQADQRIKAQKIPQQQIHRPNNMSPMNVPVTNAEHTLGGVVVGNSGDDGVANIIGAAGGEGPTCIAASAANKSSDDSSDCQG